MIRQAILSALALSLCVGSLESGPGAVLAQTVQNRPAPPQPRRRQPTTREALDRYLRGDYEGLARFDTVDAERWIGAGGQAAVERRRLAAATYVLEYSAARPHQIQLLTPWARGVLAGPRASHPQEALWLRASVALSEGFGFPAFLLENHIGYARRRLPDDPYIQMAEAVGYEVQAARLGRSSTALPDIPPEFDRIMADVRDTDAARSAARAVALDHAAALLEGLTAVPAVRAEAHLRLGFVRLRQGQRDVALGHFDQIDGFTRDAGLRYLGHLYAGWSLASAGRPAEAISAYRAALLAIPNAQSATALLLATMMTNEQLADAEKVADAFLARESAARDPWQVYFLGDGPEYGALVLRLREALR